MRQVSEVIVRWTPETSGRVKHIEIQSRILGSVEWTEQAGAFDPQAGEFRFTSNAPSSHVEVRCRYTNTDNIPGDWFFADITTAPAIIGYGEIDGTPRNLGDINAGEGTKLGGIADGADVTGDNTAKDTNAVGGKPATDVIGAITDRNGAFIRAQALQDDILALTETYGDTASAEAARIAAEAARDASQLAETNSKAARDAAQARAAEAAQSKSDASGFATTASGQATIATQKADAAGQFAQTAEAHVSTATTKAGEAKTFRDEAATSASNASGSANTATQQAGLAAGSAHTASGHAQAASNSASTATAKATDAGNSATAANQSKLDAQAANGTASGHATAAAGSATTADQKASAAIAASELAASFSASEGLTANARFSTGPNNNGWTVSGATYGSWYRGKGYRANPGFTGTIYGASYIPVDTSRKYRQTADVTVHGEAGLTTVIYVGFECYNAAMVHLGNTYMPSLAGRSPSGNVYLRTNEFSGEDGVPVAYRHSDKFISGTRFVRLLALLNYPEPSPTNVTVDLAAVIFEEVTTEKNAQTYASEAESSAATASADAATATAKAELAANYYNGIEGSPLAARLQTVETVTTNGTFAAASTVSSLSSTVGSLSSTVSSQAGTLSTVAGRVGAYWSVEAAAGGRARLRAYADGYGSLIDIAADQIYLGNMKTLAVENGRVTVAGDLYCGAGRIVMNNGSYMKVMGTGFGSSNQFIEWFGPTQASISNCTESNAVSYLRTNGQAYFGGSLSAGILRNAVTATDINLSASVQLGPFGSNGGSRTYVLSYNYSFFMNTVSGGSYSGTPTATIELRRNNADGPLVTTLNVSGSGNAQPAFGPGEPGFVRVSMDGSTTVVDNSGGPSVTLYARLVARNEGSIGGDAQRAPTINQAVTIVSTEG